MDEDEKPRMEDLPIDWVDPGVCEETFENRRLLRSAGLRWRPVPPGDDGQPSGLVQVADPALDAARMAAERRDILRDPRDPWSDYVDVRELPLDVKGVPFWIHRRAEKWERWSKSEGKPVEPGTAGPGVVAKAHAGKEPHLPTRCRWVRVDRTRCWGWCAEEAGDGYCRAHAPGAALRANMGHQIMLAKVKLMQAMPAMVDELEGLALGAASEQVRLKAVTEMMDRGGVHSTTDVNLAGGLTVDVQDPAEVIRSRLGELGERLAAAELKRKELEEAAEPRDVVDAETVDEPEGGAA